MSIIQRIDAEASESLKWACPKCGTFYFGVGVRKMRFCPHCKDDEQVPMQEFKAKITADMRSVVSDIVGKIVAQNKTA